MENLKNILERAINTEDRAYRLFSKLAEKENDPLKRQILEELAQEEMEHTELLKVALNFELDQYNFDDISEIENSNFFSSPSFNKEEDSHNDELDFKSVMKYSKDRAKNAYDFFKLLESAALSKNLKYIYERISNLELALQHRISEILYAT